MSELEVEKVQAPKEKKSYEIPFVLTVPEGSFSFITQSLSEAEFVQKGMGIPPKHIRESVGRKSEYIFIFPNELKDEFEEVMNPKEGGTENQPEGSEIVSSEPKKRGRKPKIA